MSSSRIAIFLNRLFSPAYPSHSPVLDMRTLNTDPMQVASFQFHACVSYCPTLYAHLPPSFSSVQYACMCMLQHPPPSEMYDDRRKSHGGDSKYGFASGGSYGSDLYASCPPPPVSSGAGGTGGGGSSMASIPGSPYSSVPPPGYSSRPPPPQQQNLPPPMRSPHHRRSPNAPPSTRGPPPQVGYSSSSPGGNIAPPPYLNGHSPEGAPDVPPKVDRTSKPGRVRSGQDFGSGKDLELDANNYMNTGRGSDSQHKVRMCETRREKRK